MFIEHLRWPGLVSGIAGKIDSAPVLRRFIAHRTDSHESNNHTNKLWQVQWNVVPWFNKHLQDVLSVPATYSGYKEIRYRLTCGYQIVSRRKITGKFQLLFRRNDNNNYVITNILIDSRSQRVATMFSYYIYSWVPRVLLGCTVFDGWMNK